MAPWSIWSIAAGFIGALIVCLLLYFLSYRFGALKIKSILLYGVMLSYFSSSLIMLIMSLARVRDLTGIIYWTMGSLDSANFSLSIIILIISVMGLIVAYFIALDLNALSVGEECALQLGVRVERFKKITFLLSSFLTGVIVSSAGVIGFVGLVVPHIMRRICGRDHRILLLSSYLAGAAFLVLADTLARVVIAPVELPVGVITGIIGSVLFICLLGKNKNI